jgi:hypothetical protein
MINGVPVGAQTEVLDTSTRGCPSARTRVEPLVQVAETHGPFATVGGGRVQPATVYGAVMVTVACELTMTRVFGWLGCA